MLLLFSLNFLYYLTLLLKGQCTALSHSHLHFSPCQASSVPCEHLFSASKQTAEHQRASLGADQFEELQIMKFACPKNVTDLTIWNSGQIEEVDLDEFKEMHNADKSTVEFNKMVDEFIMKDD